MYQDTVRAEVPHGPVLFPGTKGPPHRMSGQGSMANPTPKAKASGMDSGWESLLCFLPDRAQSSPGASWGIGHLHGDGDGPRIGPGLSCQGITGTGTESSRVEGKRSWARGGDNAGGS